MGFKEDIDKILSFTPDTKNTWLFSATMPREVRAIMKNYMENPFELQVGEQNTGNVNIEHTYVIIQDKDKYLALKRILDFNPDIFGLIFCRTRIDTQRIAEMLMKDGYSADALHGDLTQQQRDRVMNKFRQRGLQILVATDVAARGIDVDSITHVIHQNIPDELEFYTHRSGRTARAGKKGVSIAMISRRELGRVKQLEKSLKTTFKKLTIPTGPEVCQKQLLALMHKVREVKVNDNEIAEFLPAVEAELKDLTKSELIKRFASIEFNRFLDYYRNAPDLNVEGGARRDSSNDSYSSGNRFFINLGKMDGLEVPEMLDFIQESCRVDRRYIGKVELKGAFSFFEVDKDQAEAIFNGFKGVEYKGRQVRVEVTEGRSHGSSSRGDSRGESSGRDYKRSSSSSSSRGSRDGGSRDGGGYSKRPRTSGGGGGYGGDSKKKRW